MRVITGSGDREARDTMIVDSAVANAAARETGLYYLRKAARDSPRNDHSRRKGTKKDESQ